MKIQTLQPTSGRVVKEVDLNQYERLIQVKPHCLEHFAQVLSSLISSFSSH